MARTYPFSSRSIQALRLLNEHGALSAQTIRKLVQPECSKQYTNWMLSKLKRNGLVRARHDRLFGKNGVFYELRSEELSRKTVANLLCEPTEKIRISNGLNRELLHAEEQAIWVNALRQKFYGSQVIPEGLFFGNMVIQNLMVKTDRRDDFSPDIVMLPYGAYSDSPFSIAIEIERSQKNKKRIREKLSKYASGSKFDAVLYVCSRSGIEEVINRTYTNSQIGQGIRIQKYADRFLAFGKLNESHLEIDLYTAGVNSRSMNLKSWINDLAMARAKWDGELQQAKDSLG